MSTTDRAPRIGDNAPDFGAQRRDVWDPFERPPPGPHRPLRPRRRSRRDPPA